MLMLTSSLAFCLRADSPKSRAPESNRRLRPPGRGSYSLYPRRAWHSRHSHSAAHARAASLAVPTQELLLLFHVFAHSLTLRTRHFAPSVCPLIVPFYLCVSRLHHHYN